MATYHNDFAELQEAFLAFLHCLPFYGLAVVCLDDPVIQTLLPTISRPVTTYGFDSNAQIRALGMQQKGTQTEFRVQRINKSAPLDITLNLPGVHNVLNALAAIAVATELGISDASIQAALKKFAGIGRRFQIHGDFLLAQGGSITLVDDYGHHPREIAATIQAARMSWPERRLVMVYQPHRYTRTRDLFDDFCSVLSQPDLLILLDVYAAGEASISGADSAALLQAVSQQGTMSAHLLHEHEMLPAFLQSALRDNDILLMQGAGNIGRLAANLANSKLATAVSDPFVTIEAR